MIRPSKILIVDDEPFNIDYLEQELEDLGYVTVSARNGREALEKVTVEAPDLILLDVMMPIMDGLTVCRILKGDNETRLIPIVIMTALDGIDDRIKGIEAGADDFLTKPVNQRELLARIQTTLRLKHTVDQKLSELRRVKDHLTLLVKSPLHKAPPGVTREGVLAEQSGPAAVDAHLQASPGARRSPGRCSWPWHSGVAAGGYAPSQGTDCAGDQNVVSLGTMYSRPPPVARTGL